MDRTGEVTWRAWLGMGDADWMDQIDVAEFDCLRAAREWVEDRLATVASACLWSRPGMSVFGSVDRGRYQGPRWSPDVVAGAMLDADLVDGRVSWRRPGGKR
ncbi:hypothetical protein [Actinophytocola sp.]|jgi:hypothetical protein|uniref:hypothetical protein n=1 Tax=Actinophytocola sp. TaxID=1872138 RepID=UPI002ED9640E